ncbi:MAG: hypothetical protein GQ582_02025 [Methyloprofundus sp.]|nr:hypothetical protein [Methyloprofundus sp.]
MIFYKNTENLNMYKKLQISILMLVASLFIPNFAVAAEKPDASITIEAYSIALGFGVNWGTGKLKYKGKTYNFKINGLSVVDLGASNLSLVGEVYGLDHVSDFAGTYSAASIGIAIGGGAGASILENQHDVVLKVVSKKEGVQLTLATGGLRIKIID